MKNTQTPVRRSEVLTYLESFINYERSSKYPSGPSGLGTRRMEELLRGLDSPHLAAPALHVAGTKGKGSTTSLSARLLRAMGYKVGAFLSPHVESFTERIQIDCTPLPDEALGEAFARVRPAVEAMRAHPRLEAPTYFEIVTALAFTAFAAAGVDVVVLEVGLGGRLDATNVQDLPTRACAITPISRDHTRQLGDDLRDIAAEKAGIMRPGVPLVLAPQEARVRETLTARARELGCRIVAADSARIIKRLRVPPADMPEAPQRLDLQTWRAMHLDVPLPLLGRHQAGNAALALALVEAFLETKDKGPVDTAALRRAWREAVIPGRIEVLARAPWVVLDGAHNPASAWALSETLAERFSTTGRTLVFAAARDKEVRAMLRVLAPLAQAVVLTTIPSPRCLPPAQAAAMLRGTGAYKGIVEVEPDPAQAFARGRSLTRPEELLFVTGSLYLAGCVRPLLRERAAKS